MSQCEKKEEGARGQPFLFFIGFIEFLRMERLHGSGPTEHDEAPVYEKSAVVGRLLLVLPGANLVSREQVGTVFPHPCMQCVKIEFTGFHHFISLRLTRYVQG